MGKTQDFHWANHCSCSICVKPKLTLTYFNLSYRILTCGEVTFVTKRNFILINLKFLNQKQEMYKMQQNFLLAHLSPNSCANCRLPHNITIFIIIESWKGLMWQIVLIILTLHLLPLHVCYRVHCTSNELLLTFRLATTVLCVCC